MPYIYFTEDQKLQAHSVDLVEFLRRHGEKLIPSGRDKRLTSDHSITVRGNKWFDHEINEGGGPISFVQTFYGLTYPEAVQCLLDSKTYTQVLKQEQEKPKDFTLPPTNKTMRRVYAYLLQQRLISKDVLNAFVQKGLIYESCELSKDKTKQYHNAVFVGLDKHGVAHHAHKRGLYDQGKSYRVNVEGCDPRYSFHWNGVSDRLYVFEAPIDLLAFLTMYPENWQQHNYVSLCGTSEHAMLWMLRQNPYLQKIILCLDHDASGIESTGRLIDILHEHGYTQTATLQPEHKDWDEDVKAQHGLNAQPAEEHPQLVAACSLCQRISEKCQSVKPDQVAYQISRSLQQFRTDIRYGHLDQAIDSMESISAMALSVAICEYHRLGVSLTPQQGASYIQSRISPHRNRKILKNRIDEISMEFERIKAKINTQDISTTTEEELTANAWLDLAVSCAMASVKCEADKIIRRQSGEKNQLETMQSMVQR